MNQILLITGWQTCNIGDIGHTPGTLRFIEAFIPEAKVTVYLMRSNADVLNILQKRFPAYAFLTAPEDEGQHYNSNKGFADPLLRNAFTACDLVIQNSGMHYNRFYDVKPWVLKASIEMEKPYGLYGQSFDGFAPEELSDIVDLLSQATFIYCRDSPSLKYLKSCGVTAPVLEFGPDGCFGIDVRDDKKAERYLAENQLADGEFITVTLRSNTPSSHGSGVNRLNPKTPSEKDRLENGRWTSMLCELISSWVMTTGKKVLLTPEVDKEIKAARELILPRLNESVRDKVYLRNEFWSVDEAVSVYAKARVVVAMEPHSCIMALAMGVPTIHYFSPKHGVKAWMFDDIGLAEWLYDINQVDAKVVFAELLRMENDMCAARLKAREAWERVHSISQQMGETIRSIVGQPKDEGQNANQKTPCPCASVRNIKHRSTNRQDTNQTHTSNHC